MHSHIHVVLRSRSPALQATSHATAQHPFGLAGCGVETLVHTLQGLQCFFSAWLFALPPFCQAYAACDLSVHVAYFTDPVLFTIVLSNLESFCVCDTAASQKQLGLLHRALLRGSKNSRSSSYLSMRQTWLQTCQPQPRTPKLLLAVQLGHHLTHQEHVQQLQLKPQTSRGLLPASLPKTPPGLPPLALPQPHRLAMLSSHLGALLSALLRPSR